MILDTLQSSKDLQPAFVSQQAEALSRALAANAGVGDHAAKTDLATLRIEIKADLATVQANVATQLATFKVDVVRWIVGAIAFNVLATAGSIITPMRMLAH